MGPEDDGREMITDWFNRYWTTDRVFWFPGCTGRAGRILRVVGCWVLGLLNEVESKLCSLAGKKVFGKGFDVMRL